MKKPLLLSIAALLIGVSFLNGGGVTAANETPKQTESPRHCISGPNKPVQCFDTEAEALYVASGGSIKLVPGQTSASLSDAELAELFGVSSSVQATLYEHADYGGATLTIYSDGCYGWNNMPIGWNDVVSSARVYSCGITLYEHFNLTGAWLSIAYPGTSYVGNSMNDKASSWSLP